MDDANVERDQLRAELAAARTQLASVPLDHLAVCIDLAVYNDDDKISHAAKVAAGWLYEWKAVQP